MSTRTTTTRFAVLSICSLLAAGCATTGDRGSPRPSNPQVRAPAATATVESRDSRPSAAALAAGVAARQVGTPYRYGGASPSGFDCSGLVHYAYGKAGVWTPRTTGELWRSLQPVADGELAVGDVLFFDIEGKVSHVGLYLGDGDFVHAPSSGRHVSIASLGSGYYRRAFIRAGRL